jgi:transposase
VLFYFIKLIFFIAFMRVRHLVYVDESGLNRYYRREYARAKRGVRVYDTKNGKKQSRTNIIAGLCEGRHLAVQCYEHSTTYRFFEDWFEFELIPLLPENSIVILDNASWHRKNTLFDIAYRYDVCILFLPPYCPELNPIEHSWANFKRWLAYNSLRFPSLDFAADCFFYP